MTKSNYHTHTSRCHHAEGSDEDYVLSAIRGGYRTLGFSDHGPWHYASGFVSPTRMLPEELEEYTGSLRRLREKYAGRIDIKIGLECEYYPSMLPQLKEDVEKYGIEYLVFGNHHYHSDETSRYFGMFSTTEKMVRLYEESAIEGMETGLYACLAHPDVFMGSYRCFDRLCEEVTRNICRTANRLHLPLEYNLGCAAYCEATGEQLFPHPDFWQVVAEEGSTAIIGVDAHLPECLEISRYFDKAVQTLDALGIPRLESLDF